MSAPETTQAAETAVRELRGRVRGAVLQPWDGGYGEARAVYNALHDRWPALVVQAADAGDVQAAVVFAAAHGLPLAVRGGGHSIAGFSTCDGGLVLDLRGLRAVAVDPAGRTVRAEGGCTWGELDAATHACGLATTGGLISTTGISGLTLGGGFGHLTRGFGLACDNLVRAEVVTAGGDLLTCSGDENPDLFWALRGGGGNFGVVTSLEYRLHPVADVLGGPTFFPLQAAVLRQYLDFLRTAPERLGAVLGIMPAPPAAFVPAAWHGRPVIAVLACWTGPADEGRAVLAPLRDWAPVLGQLLEPMPYPVLNTFFDQDLPPGIRHYWKGRFVRDLSDAALDALVEHGGRVPTPESGPFLYPVDGACHAVAPDATAFAHRDARFVLGVHGSWRDPDRDAEVTRWVRECDAAVSPHTMAGGYVNFMAGEDQGLLAATYRQNYARLREVKRRYDPANLFRLNQNIPPAG